MPVKPEYKVTLLGAGGVGKSALTLRIISGQFTPQYNPTIEDYYRHDTNVEGVGQCIVEILDTAGTEQFASMRQLYISGGDAFALVYAIDNRDSFEEIQEIYQQLLEVKKQEELLVVLVGNKCDLKSRRVVSAQEGAQAAHAMKKCPFLETSAKDGTNVEEFFNILVAAVDKKARGNDKDTRRSMRLGSSVKRGRSRSNPDLRKTNSIDYHMRPGETARRRCVIL
jgi:small GTP-binding protein